MTFDDDFVRLSVNGAHRLYNVLVKDRWEWPPPEEIEGHVFRLGHWQKAKFTRVSMSEITDEQRSEMTHVARGALYVEVDPDGD